MLERHIQFAKVDRPAAGETAAATRARVADKFPRQALRRMTLPGMLVGSALDGFNFQPDDAVVYASRFAETRALEDFLSSFPTASPLLFQTSIHPSAVQQVMIGRQQPIRRFWPMTGRRRLVESALLAALMEPAARVVLVGAEERGTWLLENRMASDRAFGFAAVLGSGNEGSLGRVGFESGAGGIAEPAPTLDEFAAALESRTPLRWRGAGGSWSLVWK